MLQKKWSDTDISAYIDGQLEPSVSAMFEATLKTDTKLQQRVQEMQRVVEILRVSPTREAPRNFLLTPSMIPESAPQQRAPRRVPLIWLRMATALSAVLFIVTMGLNVMSNRAWYMTAPQVVYDGASNMETLNTSDAGDMPGAESTDDTEHEILRVEVVSESEKIVEAPPEPELAAEAPRVQTESTQKSEQDSNVQEDTMALAPIPDEGGFPPNQVTGMGGGEEVQEAPANQYTASPVNSTAASTLSTETAVTGVTPPLTMPAPVERAIVEMPLESKSTEEKQEETNTETVATPAAAIPEVMPETMPGEAIWGSLKRIHITPLGLAIMFGLITVVLAVITFRVSRRR